MEQVVEARVEVASAPSFSEVSSTSSCSSLPEVQRFFLFFLLDSSPPKSARYRYCGVASAQGKNILLRVTTGRPAVAGHTGPPKESASPSPSSLSTSSSES